MNTTINIIEQLKWSLTDVKNNTYIASIKKVNDKGHKFKVGDHIRISKYKIIFAKAYTANWPRKALLSKKGKNTVPWACHSNDLDGEEIVKTSYEKELQKTNQHKFRAEKVIKGKGNKQGNYMLNGKDMIIHLIARLKKTLLN